jgi:hypothetical protein
MVAQGHDLDNVELTTPNLRYREPMLLARNMGKNFVDVSAQSGSVFQTPWVARGMAVGDIDNDGRLDAVVTTNDGLVHVLHNETQTANHWFDLNLIGHQSNRDAIGAEVKLKTQHGSQLGIVTTASSYLSSSNKRLHFGLGMDEVVEEMEIRWPSGIIQKLQSVRGDRVMQIDEPVANDSSTSNKNVTHR